MGRKIDFETRMEIFNSSYEPCPTTGCFIWTKGLFSNGYGQFKWKQYPTGAHRVSWILNRGDIGPHEHVLHRCDNKFCVNPDHLFIGTHQDNVRDKVAKRRQAKGEIVNTNRLSEIDVQIVREYAKIGLTKIAMARVYGVSATCISRIVNAKNWKWL